MGFKPSPPHRDSCDILVSANQELGGGGRFWVWLVSFRVLPTPSFRRRSPGPGSTSGSPDPLERLREWRVKLHEYLHGAVKFCVISHVIMVNKYSLLKVTILQLVSGFC